MSTHTSDNTVNILLNHLYRTAEQDKEYQMLKGFILNGFPTHFHQLPEPCRKYWNVKQHLTLDDNLIVNGCCLLIPTQMWKEVLSQPHESHQGSVRIKQRARLTVYWPGINNAIDNVIPNCQKCQDHLPSNATEPIIQKPRPSRPFQEIAVDLCAYAGRNYLILVDCYTNWLAIISMDHGTTSGKVITAIRQSNSRDSLVGWRSPVQSKKFNDFTRQWGFTHKLSSPYYPQSNWKIEATVKAMKKNYLHIMEWPPDRS